MQKLEERQELRKIAIVEQQLASRARELDMRCVSSFETKKKVKEASKSRLVFGAQGHVSYPIAPLPRRCGFQSLQRRASTLRLNIRTRG